MEYTQILGQPVQQISPSYVKIKLIQEGGKMDKKGKRYTEEFKSIILELLREGRSKKSLPREYGVATVTIKKQWEKQSEEEVNKKENSTYNNIE